MTAPRESPSDKAKIRVMKRDRFRCTYCGIPGTDAELEIDHIIPVSKGGSNHLSNLTTACRKCNQSKGNKEMTPKYNNEEYGLVGLWAAIIRDNQVRYSLFIYGQISETKYLVQATSALSGEPNAIKIVDVSEMMDWQFYTNTELLGDEVEASYGPQKRIRYKFPSLANETSAGT
jgi:hypothetical protein